MLRLRFPNAAWCPPLPLLSLLLLLLLHPDAQCERNSLYDPYGLSEESQPQPQPQPCKAAERDRSEAASPKAYRSFYLMLLRNLTRVLDGLQPRDDSDVGSDITVRADWTLPADSLRRLRVTNTSPEPSAFELQDSNSVMLALFTSLRRPEPLEAIDSRWRWPLASVERLVPYAVLGAGAAVGVRLVVRRLRVWQLLTMLAAVSWTMNWFRLYRLALAQRQHEVTQLKCRSQDQALGFLESVGLWVSSSFRVAPVKDDCLKQLEALAVDPLWDASPLEAAADLLSNVLLNRFVQVMSAVNRGYRSLIEDLPLWHTFIITGLVISLPALLVLLRSGYSMRLLFGALHIGPDARENQLAALEAENRRLREICAPAPAAMPSSLPPPPLTPPPALHRPLSVVGALGDVSACAASGMASSPRRLRVSRSECNLSHRD